MLVSAPPCVPTIIPGAPIGQLRGRIGDIRGPGKVQLFARVVFIADGGTITYMERGCAMEFCSALRAFESLRISAHAVALLKKVWPVNRAGLVEL